MTLTRQLAGKFDSYGIGNGENTLDGDWSGSRRDAAAGKIGRLYAVAACSSRMQQLQ